jgi:hypothetical protein
MDEETKRYIERTSNVQIRRRLAIVESRLKDVIAEEVESQINFQSMKQDDLKRLEDFMSVSESKLTRRQKVARLLRKRPTKQGFKQFLKDKFTGKALAWFIIKVLLISSGALTLIDITFIEDPLVKQILEGIIEFFLL